MELTFHWPQVVIACWLLYNFIVGIRRVPSSFQRHEVIGCVIGSLIVVGGLAFVLGAGGFWTQS